MKKARFILFAITLLSGTHYSFAQNSKKVASASNKQQAVDMSSEDIYQVMNRGAEKLFCSNAIIDTMQHCTDKFKKCIPTDTNTKDAVNVCIQCKSFLNFDLMRLSNLLGKFIELSTEQAPVKKGNVTVGIAKNKNPNALENTMSVGEAKKLQAKVKDLIGIKVTDQKFTDMYNGILDYWQNSCTKPN